jgi:long-chain acyl-CoA synthetase
MGLRDFTVYDMIGRNALLFPERDAVVFGDTRLNYRDYKQACDRCAAGLVKAGIRKGDRFAVVANNSDRFLILYGAAAKIGAIMVPVNWRFQQEEIRIVLEDCTPKIVFAGAEYQEAAAAAAAKVSSVKELRSMSADAGREGFQPFDALLCADGAEAVFDIPADAGYVIIHTAAVAGRPRGALLSQANIVAVNLQIMSGSRIDDGACHLCVLPLFHISALSMAMAVMHRAGKNVIAARFDPEQALALIARERVTVFGCFAPMLKMLLDRHARQPADLSSVRSIGGLEDPQSILKFLQAAPNAAFFSGFGQTEAMAVTGCNAAERPGSAGRPSALSRVALFDDADREVPTGEVGEICVRSPTVFLGYWGLEVETEYTFRNGWHHTGDIGRFDAQGYLWYVKRKEEKELIKPGGENVYPAEVEKAILSHEGISEACVIGVPDEQWREAIKAVCVRKPGARVAAEEVIDHVAARIARFKKPKHVVFVPTLPKTKDGGIDRGQVKKEHGGK